MEKSTYTAGVLQSETIEDKNYEFIKKDLIKKQEQIKKDQEKKQEENKGKTFSDFKIFKPFSSNCLTLSRVMP